jgi:hypothetical protein
VQQFRTGQYSTVQYSKVQQTQHSIREYGTQYNTEYKTTQDSTILQVIYTVLVNAPSSLSISSSMESRFSFAKSSVIWMFWLCPRGRRRCVRLDASIIINRRNEGGKAGREGGKIS